MLGGEDYSRLNAVAVIVVAGLCLIGLTAMHRPLLLVLAALLLVPFSRSAAAVVTTTVTATVGSQIAGSPVASINPGDTVSFSFTYDNAGTAMHIFEADGSVREAFNLANYPDYYFLSDVTAVSFSPNIQALFAELGKTYHPPGKYYYDQAIGEVNASGTEILYFQIAANAEYSLWLPEIVGRTNDNGTLSFTGVSLRQSTEYGFNLVELRSVTTAVPEPTSLATWLGVALFGALSRIAALRRLALGFGFRHAAAH